MQHLNMRYRDQRICIFDAIDLGSTILGLVIVQIGKHGMILEFTDPESSRRSATYLPEVASQEGVYSRS